VGVVDGDGGCSFVVRRRGTGERREGMRRGKGVSFWRPTTTTTTTLNKPPPSQAYSPDDYNPYSLAH